MQQPIDRLSRAVPHVLFLAVMGFFSMYARTVLSPLLIPIQIDLEIGPARATQLFLPLAILYSVAMLFSGFFVERIEHRTNISLAIAVLGVGLLLVSISRSFAMMVFGFSLIGAGAGLYVPSGLSTVTALVDERIRGRAISFHELGPNSSFVIAPLIVSLLTAVGSWRLVPALSGAIALLSAAFFARGTVGGRFHGERPRVGNVGALIRKPEFWTIALFFSVVASATIGVYSILPTYLVRTHHYDLRFVNTLLSLSRISGIGMVFLSGVLVDRIGSQRLIAVVMAITGTLTIGVGAFDGSILPVIVFLQPVVVSAFFPAAISVIADLGSASLRNVAISVMIPVVSLISSGIFPTVMGALTERGNVANGFIVLGALMLATLPFNKVLRRPKKFAINRPEA